MSAQTSLRYELITSNKQLNSALQRQKDRIAYDDTMADRDKEQKLSDLTKMRTDWVENLEAVAACQKAKMDAINLKGQIKQAIKATIMVRRAQLKTMLENEYKIYEQELQKQGKAFYIKRI